jgi:tape measure domain-containing protein
MAKEEIIVVFGTDIKKLEAGLNTAGSKIKKFGDKVTGVGKKLSMKLTAPLTFAGGVALRSAAKFEKLRTTLNVLTGSAEAGGKAFERLVQFSAKTPFQLDDLVKANNTMMGFGLSADQAYGSLQQLGDIAAVAGGDLQRIAVAFGQSAAEGRVMTRDILQFINNGVPMYDLLADVTGKSASEVRELASEGKITFDVLQAAFKKATGEGGKFHKGMDILSGTLNGMFSTLKDNLNVAFAELGQEIATAFNLSENIPKLIDFIKDMTAKFKELSPETKRFLVIATAIAAALPPLLVVFGTLITSVGSIVTGFSGAIGVFTKFLPKIKNARKGILALNLAMRANPAILFASIILGAAAALFKLGKARRAAQMEKLNEEFNKLSLDEAEEKLKNLTTTYEGNNKILEENNKLAFTRRKHILNDINGDRVKTGTLKSKNKKAKVEIDLLKEIIELKKEQASLDIDSPDLDTGVGGDAPIDTGAEERAAAALKLKEETTQALLTTDQKRFEHEYKKTKEHYDRLIKLNKNNASIVEQLEKSKGEKLKSLSDKHYEDLLNAFTEYGEKKKELETQVQDASAVTDEQKKQLEIQRTKDFYTQLIAQAKKFGIDTSALQEAQKLKIAEIIANYTEQQSGFATAQENINSVLQASFTNLGNSITNAFAGSKTVLGAFLGAFIQTATSIMAANLATSMSSGVDSAGKTAASFGPAAAFVLPGLVAGAMAVVSKAFNKIPKFAQGGIVSTPTLGMFGEYPGASRNPEVVAPLDKLKNMIGGSGGGKVQVAGEFRLKGQDLVVALERANTNRNRII